MMELEQGGLFTDKKYNSDVIIRHISESVVMASETDSGFNRLYGREQFEDGKGRFVPQ